jgi:hypothetical protein
VRGERLPAGLHEVVRGLLEKDPARRLGPTQDVADTLRALLAAA